MITVLRKGAHAKPRALEPTEIKAVNLKIQN